jgi:MFS family permease
MMGKHGTAPQDLGQSKEASARYTPLIIFLCACQAILSMDFGMAGVVIPRIGMEFGLSSPALAGFVSSYALVYACLLLTGGRIADTFGRRLCCGIGLSCFIAGTVLVILSWDFSLLLAARALQGIGAALLAPASFSLMNTVVPEGAPRRRAYATLGAAQGLATAAGPLFAGLLTAKFGWRASYLVDIVLAGGLLMMLRTIVPKTLIDRGRLGFDYIGALLIAAMIVCFVVAVAGLPGFSLSTQERLAIGAVSLLLLGLLVLVERRAAHPLLPPALFTRATAITAPIAMAATMAASTGLFLLPNTVMQNLFGWSAAASGLGMLPLAVGGVLTGQTISHLFRRYSLKQNIAIGFGGLAASLVLFAVLLSHGNYGVSILAPMLLGGWASLICVLSLLAAGAEAVEPAEQGTMSALIFSCQQIGIAAGSAIVLAAAATGGGVFTLPTLRHGFLIAAIIAVVGFLVAVPASHHIGKRQARLAGVR